MRQLLYPYRGLGLGGRRLVFQGFAAKGRTPMKVTRTSRMEITLNENGVRFLAFQSGFQMLKTAPVEKRPRNLSIPGACVRLRIHECWRFRLRSQMNVPQDSSVTSCL